MSTTIEIAEDASHRGYETVARAIRWLGDRAFLEREFGLQGLRAIDRDTNERILPDFSLPSPQGRADGSLKKR